MLLTDEEIKEASRGIKVPSSTLELEEWFGGMDKFFMEVKKVVAEAQLKKVIEWGNQQCTTHANCGTSGILTTGWYRKECPKCWQALLEEVK